jgi:lysophospholipase L1-like esterase
VRSILCFGDSNTWGTPPGGEGRYSWGARWTGVVQRSLGDQFRVIEEGLPGRTTCFEDPFSPHRNGLTYLPVALETHAPLDLLLLMLGTNDLKADFNLSPLDIARGAARLLVVAKNFRPAIKLILLVSPPHVTHTENVDISRQFPQGEERSKSLAAHYQREAELHVCHFFDAASVAEASPIDGIHLDALNHKRLGDGIALKVLSIFGEEVS